MSTSTTDYSTLSVSLLRKQMNTRKIGPSVGAGEWRAKLNKFWCIHWLEFFDHNGETATLLEIDARYKTESKSESNSEAPSSPAKDNLSEAVSGLVNALKGRQNAPVELDEGRVVELIKEHAPTPPKISITVGDQPTVEIGRQHYKYPLLEACHAANVPVLLVGPAGSGKTTVASALAERAGKSWNAISAGPMTTKADLFGFRDAHGKYHESSLVQQATQGGIFLCDEIDAANAGVLTGINMVLANGHIATPDGLREKHEDFFFVAGANTYGSGANRQYVGRNALDAATLDRFAVIDWDIDEGLEAHTCGIDKPSPKLHPAVTGWQTVDAESWLNAVQKYRKAAAELDLKVVISPRASQYGVRLAACGLDWDHLLQLLIYKGLPSDTVNRLANKVATYK